MSTTEGTSTMTTTADSDQKNRDKKNKAVQISSAPTSHPVHPWLLIHHGKKNKCQTFYSISNQSCYKRQIPELSNKIICNSSANGWLVVEHLDSDDFFLFNLASKEKIQLPQLEQPHSNACVLTSVPSDPDCLVLFVSKSGTSIMFYRPSSSDHHHKEEVQKFDLVDVDGVIVDATSVQGKIYCCCETRGLAMIDFSFPKPRLVNLIPFFPDTSLLSDSLMLSKVFMVESRGELLLVELFCRGVLSRQEVTIILVFRADLSSQEWIKVDDIGERAIFLDTEQGICLDKLAPEDGIEEESARFKVKKNTIYFVQPYDRCLYSYDLKVEKTVGCLPSSHVNTIYSDRRWIMMSS